MARLCAKLGGKPWRPATCVALAALHEEPHARKVLAHLPAVTRRVLKMAGKPGKAASILFTIEIVRRVRTDLTDRQIIASLERMASWRMCDWVEAH